MSEFTAIRAVSKTLQALLQLAITNSPNPQLQGVPIELSSPRELRDAANNNPVNAISLWLYRVARSAGPVHHGRREHAGQRELHDCGKHNRP